MEAVGRRRYRLGPGRPRGHHLPGRHLRNLRVVRRRPRALLSETNQLRLHPAGCAWRLRHGSRLRPGARPARTLPPPRLRRSAAPVGPPTARSAKRPSRPASRWPSSATAASATWPCRSRSIRDCTLRFPILRTEKLALARAAGASTGAPPRNMDAAIVFTAAPAAIPQAFRSLRRNGTLILVGLVRHVVRTPPGRYRPERHHHPRQLPRLARRSGRRLRPRRPGRSTPARAHSRPRRSRRHFSNRCAAASFRDGP